MARYEPLVRKIAHRVHMDIGGQQDLDELVAYGYQGLIEARNRFDPDKGAQFKTFAYYRVRGSMLDGLRKLSDVMPKSQLRVLRAAAAASDIGESAGTARAAVRAAGQSSTSQTVEAIDGALARLTTSFVASWAAETETSPEAAPDEEVIKRESAQRARDAVAQLPERHRIIVQALYFEGRRLEDVGEDLGISKSWASRLHTQALDKLRGKLRG